MRGMASILEAASRTEIKGRERLREERGRAKRSKNERGGETGKRDEAEIQKILTS